MIVEDWGLVEYESSSERQLELVDRVAGGEDERLVFVTHPPVVTLGRATRPEDLIGWSGKTVETSRGGRATYHGPNQVIIYPILDLRRERQAFGARDIHAYLRALETAAVEALHELGLKGAEARTSKVGEDLLTGVWVGPKKIASIGIAVRKWVSYHGIAINILHDPRAHQGIRPCGFTSDVMTSLEAELGQAEMNEAKKVLERVLTSRFC